MWQVNISTCKSVQEIPSYLIARANTRLSVVQRGLANWFVTGCYLSQWLLVSERLCLDSYCRCGCYNSCGIQSSAVLSFGGVTLTLCVTVVTKDFFSTITNSEVGVRNRDGRGQRRGRGRERGSGHSANNLYPRRRGKSHATFTGEMKWGNRAVRRRKTLKPHENLT